MFHVYIIHNTNVLIVSRRMHATCEYETFSTHISFCSLLLSAGDIFAKSDSMENAVAPNT